MARDRYGLQRWRAVRQPGTECSRVEEGGNGSSITRGRVAQRAPLLTRIGYSGVSQLFPLLATFILTPFLIARLGLDRFGIWSLALVLLATLTALDGGMIPSLARFFALYGARHDRASAGRLLVGSSALFLLLGVLAGVIALLLGSQIIGLASIPRPFQHDAVQAIRFLGPLLALALISDGVTALLQANQRFAPLAAVSACSAVGYVVTAMVLVAGGGGFGALIAALSVRYGVVIVIGLFIGGRHMRLSRPVMPDVAMRRAVWSFALPMQISGVVTFVAGETDALVIALLLPVRYVGLYSVGYQAAVALRSLPTYAFPPLLTRMTEVFATRGRDGAVAEFRVLGSQWLQAVLGYGAVATAAVGFGVRAWLGNGFAVSELVAVVLMAGFTLHVGITGMRTCFVRAVGRPGLETRYSVVAMIINVVLTVPLALFFGVTGVVVGTAVGLTGGSLYFVRLCGSAKLRERTPRPGFALVVLLVVALTIISEVPLAATGWHGLLPLLLACVPPLTALALIANHLRSEGDPGLSTSRRMGDGHPKADRLHVAGRRVCFAAARLITPVRE